MEVPKELYTISTLFTLGGSASAVWIITSVIGYLSRSQNIKEFKKWLGLILSLIFAFLGATLIEEQTVLTWVVAVVNGFLVYLTAVGINTVVAGRPVTTEAPQRPTRDADRAERKTVRSFRERWL